ncbi:MAG TPA: phosphate acyltransferase PlsX [Balneolales bacterium]|nr:phosphate acyltransferase PlsX [Balneolales bacterium]
MRIAVDAVGGDSYPKVQIEGAIEALEKNDNINVTLLGPEELIAKELNNYSFNKNKISIFNAPQIIGMDESPAKAVKMKVKSSIVLGLALQKKGKCDAFISAGNTGALLAASTFILGKLEGVLRPTIAALYPTIKGFRLLVDAGANLEVKPEMLYQFAIMGKVYSEQVLGVENPRIGLLNVGEEEEKGTEVLKETYKLLSKTPNFIGNIEGRDILPCNADVFVCDGLIGNITLKFGESLVEAFQILIGQGIKKNKLSEEQQQIVLKVISDVISPFDYQAVGGVPFLGVDGVSLVGHGSSSSRAIKNMILNAALCVENKVNSKIVSSLKN